jgi:hypothetical protein
MKEGEKANLEKNKVGQENKINFQGKVNLEEEEDMNSGAEDMSNGVEENLKSKVDTEFNKEKEEVRSISNIPEIMNINSHMSNLADLGTAHIKITPKDIKISENLMKMKFIPKRDIKIDKNKLEDIKVCKEIKICMTNIVQENSNKDISIIEIRAVQQ